MNPGEKLLLDYVDERIHVARAVMASNWYAGDLEGARREYTALRRLREVREGMALRCDALAEIRARERIARIDAHLDAQERGIGGAA